MPKSKIRLQIVSDGDSRDSKPSEARPIGQRPVLAAFPRYDEYILPNQNVDRLSLVARAACLIQDLVAAAQEGSPDETGWVSYGLGQALRAISEEPECSSMGVLLTALEAIVPSERRAMATQ